MEMQLLFDIFNKIKKNFSPYVFVQSQLKLSAAIRLKFSELGAQGSKLCSKTLLLVLLHDLFDTDKVIC